MVLAPTCAEEGIANNRRRQGIVEAAIIVGAREREAPYLRTASISARAWCEWREVRAREPRRPA